ncbi:ferric-chelate reductase Frp1 [Cryomyces antarcticus]|uniref:ferric-chelate reductase (NADPH) n=1 Tax=Cryomyces antarcticus TaxID=329879 RepID=A0ABR0M083_9PEZI|nr:ferric-chelate reductase Frp1 [Cryomyces antarcticus]KAK5021111.1 ferric-chelate reductase Frp1 [Cryomyces antarcticus]KAK5257527.1 ferric-chelate reductase Frp1 [Cryomyces antarcticus]
MASMIMSTTSTASMAVPTDYSATSSTDTASAMPSMNGMGMTGMGIPGIDSSAPLSTDGLDMTNGTIQAAYLAAILDDTELQIVGNRFAENFWYGIVVVIFIAALLNVIQRMVSRSRLRAAASNRPHPARPSNIFSRSMAFVTKISRKITYPQWSPSHHTGLFKLPPVGIILIILTYFGFLFALEYIHVQVAGDKDRQARSIRAGWLSITQVPLLVLLAGKNNLIGAVTGVSYERLNVLHRWVARGLLLTTTMHFAYQNALWDDLGLLQLEWNMDTCPPTGVAAYAIVLWMNITTIAPVRNWWYEFFVIQHILTFFGFIIAIMYHLPSTALWTRVYIWIPIGLYLLDRLLRSTRYAYHNIHLAKATLTDLPGGVTRICVRTPQISRWSPGSHVLLSIPRFGIGQSHPATIASIPSSHDGELVFLLRAHDGFTKRVYNGSKAPGFPSDRAAEKSAFQNNSYFTLLDGPYGASHADFAAFDTAVLIAASTGITFTLPILLDLAARAAVRKLPLRALTFIWIVKSAACASWVDTELSAAADALRIVGIEVEALLFVTCDESFVGEDERQVGGCDCDTSKEPCCCVQEAEASGERVSGISTKRTSETDSQTRNGQQERRGPVRSSRSGRPDIKALLSGALAKTEGETGVAVCGPLSLSCTVRNAVAAANEGEGVYLHAESFGW